MREIEFLAFCLTALARAVSVAGLEIEHRGGGGVQLGPLGPPVGPGPAPPFPGGAPPGLPLVPLGSPLESGPGPGPFPGSFLPRYPSYSSSSQSFSSQSSSFSKSHAFSNSYAVGPDGQPRLVHQAFSQSGSNSSNDNNAGTGSHAYSSAGSTPDGRVFSESGADSSHDPNSPTPSDATSSSFSRSGGALGSRSESSSSSSGSNSQSHSFSSSAGGGGSDSNLYPPNAAQHLVTQIAEVPIIRPVVPILEDFEEPLLLPLPIIQEVSYVPINLATGNQISQVVGQRRPQKPPPPPPLPPPPPPPKRVQQTVTRVAEKPPQRKPIPPVRRYQTVIQDQQKVTRVNVGEQERKRVRPTITYVQPEFSRVTVERNEARKPVVPVRGFQSVVIGQQNKVPALREEEKYVIVERIEKERKPIIPSEYTTVIREEVQTNRRPPVRVIPTLQEERITELITTPKIQTTKPEEVYVIKYESKEEPEIPNVYYESEVNTEDVIREGLIRRRPEDKTDINNIISQLTREKEVNGRPVVVVRNEQITSKNSGTRPIITRPFEEDLDNVVRIVESSEVKSTGTQTRPQDNTGSSSTESFRTAESKSGQPIVHYGHLIENGEKFLMFNGHRYTSEDLAKEFNKTRPTLPPAAVPTAETPKTTTVSQAEATTSTVNVKEHPELKPNNDVHELKKGSNLPTTQFFGKHFHQFVPPAYFDSPEFSRFFFDNYRPGFPLPSATDFSEAIAKPPPPIPGHFHHPPNSRPTNYFIHPGTINHESQLPDMVLRDMMQQGHSFSSASSSSASHVPSESIQHFSKARRPTRVHY